MKLQIATMALAEKSYMNFTVHLHDDLRVDLLASGKDLKTYLRDRITRQLRGMFAQDRPGFLFVMEDQDSDGQPTRPHAHGSIAIPRIHISNATKGKRRLAAMVAVGKEREAELLVGRMVMRDLLKAASGNGLRASTVASSGRFQGRNIWTKQPTFIVQTHHWVDYAFKNTSRFSAQLGDGREALSHQLSRQARDLWEVIRNGDHAVEVITARG